MALLTRDEILEALRALAAEVPTGHVFHLAVVGGAAMVLEYAARPSTKDVDGFVVEGPAADLREAALRVAATRRLPEDWLNDAAKGFVHGLVLGASVLETPSLVVRVLAPEQLLAMKLSAWRDDTDIDDARLLVSQLRGERQEVWAKVEPHVVPGRKLKARYAFDDLWEAQHGAP